MKKALLLATTLLTVFSFTAQAQFSTSASDLLFQSMRESQKEYDRALETGKGLRWLQSSDLTFGICLPVPGVYHITTSYDDQVSKSIQTTSQEFKFISKPALVVSALGQYNIIDFNATNALALVIGSEARVNFASPITDQLEIINASYIGKLDYIRWRYAMPIGFSFKTGGLASHDKADNSSFAIGATIAPTFYNLTLLRDRNEFYSRTRLYS